MAASSTSTVSGCTRRPDLTPEEIHQLGLDQVARIEAELAELREEIGFEATSEETAMEEFLDQVRSDPRFIAESPEEVEERYMGYIEMIEPHVADYFDVLPEAPYGVRRLDPTSEATMTFGACTSYRPPPIRAAELPLQTARTSRTAPLFSARG